MEKHALSKEIAKQVKAAVKQFGSHSFDDKGPEEVMDLNPLMDEFKKLSQKEKVQVAKDLKKASKETSVLVSLVSDDDKLKPKELNEIVAAGGFELQDHFNDGGTSYGTSGFDD